MKLEGKAALVTGGGTGVGRATALALAERGCAVLVNYSRSKDEAEATAEEIRSRGVAGKVIESRFFGEKQPRDAAGNKQAWAKNRRVTLWLAEK